MAGLGNYQGQERNEMCEVIYWILYHGQGWLPGSSHALGTLIQIDGQKAQCFALK